MQSRSRTSPQNQRRLSRRAFVGGTTTAIATLALAPPALLGTCTKARAATPSTREPIGDAKGIHPGRVVWVHDPEVLQWEGPGHGHWYEDDRTRQARADQMMSRAVCALTGASTVATAWDRLFRHLNRERGKGAVGYQAGEKIIIKPNWVGMIWREGAVNPETYTLIKREDYMNTSPQLIISLLHQLVGTVGAKEADITVCDTLAYLVNEYHTILHRAFPHVQYEDYAGRFGRVQVKPSAVPFFWSCRPDNVTPDFVPTCCAEAEYLVNFANLKAHVATGVTLCAKNHFGSLVRWPVQRGYYDMHRHSFRKETELYREQVDFMGHAHLGGKTVLHLIDGLFCGKHPIDPAPRRMASHPFQGDWPKSLFASQDPVAIDSVGFDFLHAEYDDYPRLRGVDDYLHEAALAQNPPSETFYDPNHETATERLVSLGTHEHWNNPVDKQYSRNLDMGSGIELIRG